MSINNSYFSRNNTIVHNSYVNTGRNPVMQLYYGDGGIGAPFGFSRFIFDSDLTLLREKLLTGIISTGCTDNITHVLKMTNTSSFSQDLLNTSMPDGSLRSTSFDLILCFLVDFVLLCVCYICFMCVCKQDMNHLWALPMVELLQPITASHYTKQLFNGL